MKSEEWFTVTDFLKIKFINKNRFQKIISVDMKKNKSLQDLDNYYKDKPGLYKIKNGNDRRYQYFIHFENKLNNIIFIILTKNEIIENLAYIDFDDFDKVKHLKFYFSQKYVKASNKKYLHEIIYGKKAEKGGWKKIQKSDNNTKAIWITNLSGKSINFLDPTPDNKNFYYYYDELNKCNVKVKAYDENSSWFLSEKKPLPTDGFDGDYWKDELGNLYFKVGQYNLDHINLDVCDSRKMNIREITCSSNGTNRRKQEGKYIGVTKKDENKWSSSFTFKGKSVTKTFSNEKDAASFYDYNVLALNGVFVQNNETLDEITENNLYLYGDIFIPDKYKVKRKELPVGINFYRNKYKVERKYKKMHLKNNFESLEEAIEELKNFNNKIQDEKEREKKEKEMSLKYNLNEKYGYIEIKEKKYKLNIETYYIFIHINWHLNKENRPLGVYNGKKKQMHIHVYEYYNKNYNKEIDGTIDHINGDVYDCTIESLRCASYSLQSHNVRRRNILGYHGISLARGKFSVNSKSFEILEDALRYYNDTIDKKYGKDESGNSIGNIHLFCENKKTTMKDFFGKDKINTDFLDSKNITVSELKTIFYINEDWRKIAKISNIKEINSKTKEFFKNKLLSIVKENV